MENFTKEDVLAYHIGLMTDPAERVAIEYARDNDPKVRQWFGLLVEDEYKEIPAVFWKQAEELADRWMAEVSVWVRNPTLALPFELEPGRVSEIEDALVFRQMLPKGQAAYSTTIDDSPVEAPYIGPDEMGRYLRICQRRDAIPDGRVNIVVVRHRGTEPPVSYRTGEWSLDPSEKGWYRAIPLLEVLPEVWEPGDDILYYARPSTAPESSTAAIKPTDNDKE